MNTQKRRENKSGSKSWQCANRLYKGGIVTDSNKEIPKILERSICTSNVARNEIKLELFHCKQQAASSEGDPLSSIYNKSLLKLKNKDTDLVEALPTFF